MNMNLQASTCAPDRVESFLSGALSAVEEREFTQHLNSCDDCRRSLERQAAESESWMEAEQLLKPVPFDGAPRADDEAPARQPTAISCVLDALGPTDDPVMLGRLGGYEVSGVVGAGGMGVVLKAVDKSLDRTVAIKVLAPHLATSGAARKRFAREAKAAAAVLHPNVIAIHSVSNDESLPYLVMPYVRGTSLQKRLDKEGPLSVTEVLRIGSQIAAGLAAAHAQGLVHRDIKPANILLEEGIERVAITDFGLARAVDDATITHSGTIAGTPQYMSPEQARGESVDQRSDLFSLGSVLYAICTGRAPFRADTTYGVMRRITDDEPTAIRELNPEIPAWFGAIVAKLMSKRAADRFASSAEVAELLAACLAHVQQPATVPLPSSLPPSPPDRSSFFTSSLGKGVLAMLGAFAFMLLGLWLWHGTEAPDIAGRWTGAEWGTVVLNKTGDAEYAGTYTDTYGKEPGKIELRWSRIERRYYGTWREDEDRFGELSVRLVGDEIRGAHTTDSKSKINPATPRLADLAWKRSPAGSGLPQPPRAPGGPPAGLGQPPRSADSFPPYPNDPPRATVPGGLPEGGYPTPTDPQFAEAKEIVLSMDGMKFMLDFDSGKTMDPPATIRPEQEKMDVYPNQVQPYHYPTALTGSSLRGVEMKASDWNASVADVRRALEGKDVGPMTHMDLGPEKNPTYFFKTRDGAIGVLQLIELTHEPKGIRLRYKTVKSLAAGSPKLPPSEQPTAPQSMPANTPPATSYYEMKSIFAAKTSMQIRIAAPEGMTVAIAGADNRFDQSPRLKVPARLNLAPGKTYRLKLSEIPGRPGLELYPTVEIPAANPNAEELLQHGVIPLEFTAEDFDAVAARDNAIFFKLVVYEKNTSKLQTVNSSSADAITRAVLTGTILCIVRIGNIDLEGDQFPPAVIPPMAPSSAAPSRQSSTFGPVMERLVPANVEPTFIWFDLDTGKALSAGDAFPGRKDADITEDEYLDWRKKHGVDVAAGFGNNSAGLKSLDRDFFFAIPVNADQWELMTPALLDAVFEATPVARQSKTMLANAKLPATFVFKTRQNRGILQITAVNEPRGIDIRYKFVQQDGGQVDAAGAGPGTTGAIKRLRHFSTDDAVSVIAFSSDGKRIAVANDQQDWSRAAKILDAANGKVIATLQITTEKEEEILRATEGLPKFGITAIAFSPDGSLVAVATGIGQVKLFNAQTGELIQTLDDTASKLAEKVTPEKFKELRRAMGSVNSLAFSPGGSLLAMTGGSFDDIARNWGGVDRLGRLTTAPGRVKVWEVKGGTLLHDLAGHSHAFGVSFSANGTQLASAGRWSSENDNGSGVIVWNALTGKRAKTIRIDSNGATHTALFSWVGEPLAIATTHYDKAQETYTTELSLAVAGVVEWKVMIPGAAHPKAFASNNQWVAVLCGGKSIRFYDVKTGQLLHELRADDTAQGGRWNDAAFASGNQLIVGGLDGERKGSITLSDVSGLTPATDSAPEEPGR